MLKKLLQPCLETKLVDFVFLDSGTGGIPYMLKLKEKYEGASCVYVGDTANFPYGEKSHEEIVKCVLEAVSKIQKKFNPKIIVIACNTMSVNALDILRDAYADIQFVGTVPAIKVAGDISEKRCVGLLATKSTCNHPYNQDLKNHFAADCKMVLRGDPELISFIEHESFTSTEEGRMKACEPAVKYFRENGCDTIILGCTHFLNIKNEIQKVAAPDIKVVDSVDGVVNRALSLYGALRGVPVREGGEQRSVSQGETSPSNIYPKSILFVTGFSDKKDEKEYDVICKRYDLDFGGVL